MKILHIQMLFVLFFLKYLLFIFLYTFNMSDTTETTKDKAKNMANEGEDDVKKGDDKPGIKDEFGEDEDMDAFTAEELEEYMNKDYTELMKEFRDGIGDMTDDPAEAARLTALAEQLESSFENLEAMDDVINDVSEVHLKVDHIVLFHKLMTHPLKAGPWTPQP